MYLYNTLTRKKELFTPITKGKVLFYHCGPTVYWTQHIGNLRGMMVGDLLVRTLRYLDYDVRYIRNYTDVGHLTSDADRGEDKMEKGAKREGLMPGQIAEKYITAFEKDASVLNILDPTVKPRATAYIGEMIAMNSDLLRKGYAYTTDLAVYFDVSKFSSYTALSHQKLDEMDAGAGKAEVSDPEKKNPHDFALWFFKTGVHAKAIQTWPSPFISAAVPDGRGFPGWHIECSAMCRALLGKTIDVHLGGVEHIPVHHTNEIAQSEAANGATFVHVWLHNGHLQVNGKKMAKSEGTGYALEEIIAKGYDPLALRYFFLQAHYRSMQNFTWDALDASAKALETLRGHVRTWSREGSDPVVHDTELMTAYKQKFTDAIGDDLNIPKALAYAWEVMKSPEFTGSEKYALIRDFDAVFGLKLDEEISRPTEPVPDSIRRLVAERNKLRKDKKFSEADTVRKQIESGGFILEDLESGTNVKKITR